MSDCRPRKERNESLMATHTDLANLIWDIANLLRGPYRPPQYERVMLPSNTPPLLSSFRGPV